MPPLTKTATIPPAVLSRTLLESQLRGIAGPLAEAELMVSRLAPLRTKTSRYTYWVAHRDRLQGQQAQLRQELLLCERASQ